MTAAVISSNEKAPAGQGRVTMQFDDNMLLPQLFGERDQHLERIERQLGVSVVSRGNRLAIAGPEVATASTPAMNWRRVSAVTGSTSRDCSSPAGAGSRRNLVQAGLADRR